MVFLLLLCSIITNVMQTVFNKEYCKKSECSPIFFALGSACLTFLFFLIRSNFKFEFDCYTAISATLCAVGAISSLVCFVQAVKFGSLAISSLILNFSLAIPTLFGIIFLKEDIRKFTIPGLLLLVFSLILTNYQKEKLNINWKWVVCISIAFLGNGAFAAVQKVHQLKNKGLFANELMLLSWAIVVIALLAFELLFEREKLSVSFKYSYFAVGNGFMNGFTNLSLLLLAPIASASLVYPVMTSVSTVMLSFIAFFFYKEKLSLLQWIGVTLGILAAVFLSV